MGFLTTWLSTGFCSIYESKQILFSAYCERGSLYHCLIALCFVLTMKLNQMKKGVWLNMIDKNRRTMCQTGKPKKTYDSPTLLFLVSFPEYAKFLQKVKRLRNHTEKHSLERGTLQWSKITDPWIGMVCSWVFHSQFQEKNGIFFPLRILLVSYFEVYSTYMLFSTPLKPLDFKGGTRASISGLLCCF